MGANKTAVLAASIQPISLISDNVLKRFLHHVASHVSSDVHAPQ
jgi:hypothetical protein